MLALLKKKLLVISDLDDGYLSCLKTIEFKARAIDHRRNIAVGRLVRLHDLFNVNNDVERGRVL